MKINVRLQLKKIDRILLNLKKRRYLPSIGQIAVEDIQANFLTRGANINRSWPALADSTIKAAKRKKRTSPQPLRDTGELFGSIEDKISFIKGTVSVSTLKTINTKKGRKNIAEIHDKDDPNRKKIPQRKFMQLSRSAKKDIVRVLKKGIV